MLLVFISVFTQFSRLCFARTERNAEDIPGHSFLDTFEFFNSKFWSHQPGAMHCVGDMCLLTSDEAIRVGKTPVSNVPFLQLTLRNNCNGNDCCYLDGDCTQWTGAQLTSMHSYLYGNFRFHAVPGHEAKNIELTQEVDAFTCFSLDSDDWGVNIGVDLIPAIGISICQATSDPWSVVIVWQNGSERFNEQFRLTFNSAKRVTSYRIEWRPEKVSFWVANRLLKVVKKSDRKIPQKPLKIKIGIFPFDYTDKSLGKPTHPVEIEMSLFRVLYHKLEVSDVNHTDLFITGNTNPYKFKILSIFVISTALFVLYFGFWDGKFKSSLEHNVYTTLNDDGERKISINIKSPS